MEYVKHQSRTGLNFNQGIYIPGLDRKSTIPVMLYRGHVVKLGKGEQDYYNNHVVHKYQMHSLNAGFSGKVSIPLKDQLNYKIPIERRFHPRTPRGKWSNYPMSIEVGKYTRGFEGKYVVNPAWTQVKESPRASPTRSRSTFLLSRRSVDLPSRPLPSPLDFSVDNRYYEAIEPEIIDIMAARNEVYQSYQNRIESALLNDTDALSSPVSRLGGYSTDQRPPATPLMSKRPQSSSFIAQDRSSNLLLPVPFVMPAKRSLRFSHQGRSLSAPSVDY